MLLVSLHKRVNLIFVRGRRLVVRVLSSIKICLLSIPNPGLSIFIFAQLRNVVKRVASASMKTY